MPISSSSYENNMLTHVWFFEICKRFVYKHSETIKHVKISLLFNKFTNFTGT